MTHNIRKQEPDGAQYYCLDTGRYWKYDDCGFYVWHENQWVRSVFNSRNYVDLTTPWWLGLAYVAVIVVGVTAAALLL